MPTIRFEESIWIDKSVPDVFAAWSNAQRMANWFAPMAVTLPDVELDFREGGHYSIRMRLPGNQVFLSDGTFKEIIPNEKIVMTWYCDAFPDAATLVTVLFLPDRTGTTVRVTHENFEFEETSLNHQHGWELCLAKLKTLLEA